MGSYLCSVDFYWTGLFESVLYFSSEQRHARDVEVCLGTLAGGRVVSVCPALDSGAVAGSQVSPGTASLAWPAGHPCSGLRDLLGALDDWTRAGRGVAQP